RNFWGTSTAYCPWSTGRADRIRRSRHRRPRARPGVDWRKASKLEEYEREAEMPYVGTPVRRREDQRLITGHGAYVDDVAAPGALHAAFVRSPYAHARILSIDSSAALKLAGVAAVVLGDQIPAAGPDPRTLAVPLPPNHPDFKV